MYSRPGERVQKIYNGFIYNYNTSLGVLFDLGFLGALSVFCVWRGQADGVELSGFGWVNQVWRIGAAWAIS